MRGNIQHNNPLQMVLASLNIPAMTVLCQTEKGLRNETNLNVVSVTGDFSQYWAKEGIGRLLESGDLHALDLGQSLWLIVPKMFSDISKLYHLASKDALTDAYNHTGLELEYSRLRAASGKASVTLVLYLDADNFKQVNDRYGHSVGDKVLQAMVRRLSNKLHASDVVARLGGDEFAAFVTFPSSRAANAFIENRLKDIAEYVCSKSYGIDGGLIELPVSFSLGAFTHIGKLPKTYDALLGKADVEMYAAKRSKKSAA